MYDVLEVFGGAGGFAYGLTQAGLKVIVTDSEDHAAACARAGLEFRQLGWQEAMATYAGKARAICGGPPCQRYSRASKCRPGLAATYPDLIPPFRVALEEAGLPYVIENVEDAPLRGPVMLCGSMFGLSAVMEPYGKLGLQRHRLFEAGGGFTLADPPRCDHQLPAIRVFGHGCPGNSHLKGPGYAQACRDAMQIWWMNRDQLDEAVPPAYGHWAGGQLARHLAGRG